MAIITDLAEQALDWLLHPEPEVIKQFGHLLHSGEHRVEVVGSLPWILCAAVIWGLMMRICDTKKHYWASTAHATSMVFLAFVNLYVGPEQAMEEPFFIVMAGYFVADYLTYCIGPDFFVYGLHHSLTVMALYRTINGANWYSTLFASKCVLFEISTPFLNIFRASQKQIHGALFVLSFFLSRVVWMAYLCITGLRVSLNNFEHGVLLVFWALNLYWFLEIIWKSTQHKEKEIEKMHEE